MKISVSRPEINLDDYRSIKKIFDNKWLINGPNVQAFEKNSKKNLITNFVQQFHHVPLD